MQADSMSQNYSNTNTEMSLPPKSGFNWKRILLFVLVAVIAAASSGVSVWVYMNSQNESKTKELNIQLTTKNKSISSLQSSLKSLETQVATKTTTSSSSIEKTSSDTGLYESLVSYCKTDNKTVGFATLSNGMTNGKNDQYFGSCSVSPVGAITGGYILTAMYDNSKWTQLFGGQAPTAESAAACTKYHIPTQLATCS